MPSRNRFLLTQSLLNAWGYVYKLDDGYEDFLKTLNREPIQPNKAMLDGQRFEGLVNAVCDGQVLEASHEWYKCVMEVAEEVRGAQKQVKVYNDITMNGIDFLLYGVLDFLKAGVITDTKFSKTYEFGKYLDSPQHPMYFRLVPGAYEFRYRICDGEYVYKEVYRPEDCEPIDRTIKNFMAFLEHQNLVDLFAEKWRAK